MTVAFKLPDVGEGIHEAEIVRWLVNVGDSVREFDPIVEVQTDKALVELPAPTTGTILEIKAEAGQLAHVGDVIVVFGDPEEALASAAQVSQARETSTPTSSVATALAVTATTEVSPTDAVVHPVGRPLATPATRKLARELSVDLSQVAGTGKAGRITKEDVQRFYEGAGARGTHVEVAEEAFAASTVGASATASVTASAHSSVASEKAEERVPLRGLRRTIAQRMVQSAFTAPHVTAFDDVDMTELIQYRKQANALLADREIKLTFLPFLLKALVSGLKAFPYLNAHMDDAAGEIVLQKDYNIGIAVDTPDGLLVPVVKQVDRKSVLEVAREIKILVDKTQARTLDVSEMKGGTFTISNMGPIGGLFATPILNYPEVGILGIHKIEEKPVVRAGEIVIRSMMNLSLSFDHRVIDGATAVRFMNHLKRLLENPNLMFLEMS